MELQEALDRLDLEAYYLENECNRSAAKSVREGLATLRAALATREPVVAVGTADKGSEL
jgi:hypothetical protein